MNERSPHGHAPFAHAPTGALTPPVGARAVARDAIRTRLLDAAETLVAERQAAAITARDIARRAGASDGVLYNHFPDKHELVLAALLRRFERLVAEFQAEVATIARAATDGDLEPGLARLAEAAFRLHTSALPMLANVLSDPGLFHRFMAEIHRPPLGGRVFMIPFEDHVSAARAAGHAEADPVAAADLLVGAILLLAIVDVAGGRPREESRARVAAAVRTLVLGLAPRS